MVDREPVIFRGSASAGRGRGGNGTGKPLPVARPGNIALDVGRPLFEKGPNWNFSKYKQHLMT